MSIMSLAAATDRWNDVVSRNPDATFVYAVSSTGIYCRPSCPSRKPKRSRVAFFDTPDDAEHAGYRACKRCKPNVASTVDPWIDKIRRACVYLSNVDGHLSLATLAARIGGSPYHLQRNFTRIVGVSPREFARARRMEKARVKLRLGAGVTNAVMDAGFGSSSRFYEHSTTRLGMTPSEYKSGGADRTVRYAVVRSPVDLVLVAATECGVCRIAMGSSKGELVRELRREFPAATIQEDTRGVGRWTREVLAHLGGRQPRLDLPLDIRATAFQQMVWDALRAIPYGERRTYADVARAIGRPRSVRAVAHACAMNPAALAIPCHRVVPKSGGTGGYRWGPERKKKILARESDPSS
jgi:AraC family transcriptional regulator of adaptative response/methylated-DNA-[protein]-cysteine methyltransferase